MNKWKVIYSNEEEHMDLPEGQLRVWHLHTTGAVFISRNSQARYHLTIEANSLEECKTQALNIYKETFRK